MNCRPCPEGKVSCSEHKSKCIEASSVCDQIADCYVGEDERNCTFCTDDQVQCTTRCIDKDQLCNSIVDCVIVEADGSSHTDEENCTYCQPSSFLCKSSKTCIYGEFQCNGRRNCPDHSDEDDCVTCPSDRPMKCPNTTTCIHPCNFEITTCPAVAFLPEMFCEAIALCYHMNKSELFRCDGGRCTNPALLCDRSGHIQCLDKTDRLYCDKIQCPLL